MTHSTIINATHLRTSTNKWHKRIAIRKKPNPQRMKIKNNSLMRNIAITIRIYHSVNTESIQWVIEMLKNKKSEINIA
jgi:hypothetical protein